MSRTCKANTENFNYTSEKQIGSVVSNDNTRSSKYISNVVMLDVICVSFRTPPKASLPIHLRL